MLSIVEDMLSMEMGQAAVFGSVDDVVVNKQEQRAPEKVDDSLHKAVEIGVTQNKQEFDELEEEWNQLLKRSEAHIFQTFEWQRMWWEYFGNDSKLHILTFRSSGQLVGIAPFFLEERSLAGLYTHRNLQFIACCIPKGGTPGAFSNYSPSDYLDLIVDSEYQEQIAKALVNYLEMNRGFFDRISLNELPEEGVIMQNVVPLIEEGNWCYDKKEREVCPRIDLPETMNDFMYMIKRSLRYKLRRSKRPVTDEKLYSVRDVRSEQEFKSVFDSLVCLHQERWNSQGYPGAFADKRFESFLKDVSSEFLKRNWLRMKTAFDHDGNCLAVDLTFAFKKRIYDYQRAFDITSDLAKHRPGFALTYFLIEEAIDEEREVYDLLRGKERYKLRLASSAPRNWKVVIHNLSEEKGIKYRLNQLSDGISDLKLRIERELLLLRIHIREWGFWSFMPKYVDFIKDRFNVLKEDVNN